MSNFQFLFGQNKSSIRETCLLTPFLAKGMLKSLNISRLLKGNPYSSANNETLTLIQTHISAPYVGDAVLHLKDTPCKNLILFGSCGLVIETEKLKIGSLVSPEKAFELESFSQLLNNIYENRTCGVVNADETLLNNLKKISSDSIEIIQCASLGSLLLENLHKDLFIKKGINALDMECSAFFNAAKHIGKKAIAIFYAADILDKKNVFARHAQNDQTLINNAIARALKLIQTLAQQ